jgi:glycosyltransferase involved in cell wall biosynthesis
MLVTDSTELLKDSTHPPTEHPRQLPIRVLHFTALEKTNYFLNNLVDYCDRRAVEFTVVTLTGEGGFATDLRKRGISVYCLDCTQRRRDARACRRLVEIIRRHGVDIVHTHLFEPTLIGVNAAKLLGRAAVVTRHHSDALYRIENPLKRWAYLRLEHYCNSMADHIIAPSTEVQRILLEREKVSAAKVSLIPYGQDFRRFQSVTEADVARVKHELGMGQTLDLVCVSRLHPEKGHIYMFEALAELGKERPNITSYLVGEGPERKSLEQSAEKLGIGQSIRFLGWRDDALAIMAAADVVVHPSLHEALPSVLIEALALSKPIVASDVSGVRDIVNGYGEIVPPGNSQELADSLRLVLTDLAGANRRAAPGRLHIFQYMDAPRIAEAYLNCYRSVLLNWQGDFKARLLSSIV